MKWVNIAKELTRSVEEIQQAWQERDKWMKSIWDEEKVPLPPRTPVSSLRMALPRTAVLFFGR